MEVLIIFKLPEEGVIKARDKDITKKGNVVNLSEACNCEMLGKPNKALMSTMFQEPLPPWLVQLSGLSAGLQTKGSLVQFPVRAQAWVVGEVPSRGCMRGNHTLMFLSLFLLPVPSL